MLKGMAMKESHKEAVASWLKETRRGEKNLWYSKGTLKLDFYGINNPTSVPKDVNEYVRMVPNSIPYQPDSPRGHIMKFSQLAIFVEVIILNLHA